MKFPLRNLSVCFGILGVAIALILLRDNQSKKAELITLRIEHEELAQLRTEITDLRGLKEQVQEFDSLRKQAAEVYKLRNEVRQLRDEKQSLAQQTQKLQQTQSTDSQLQAQLIQLQNENAQLRQQAGQNGTASHSESDAAHASVCIANLKQLDGAKEQWALENRKRVGDFPTFEDLIATDKYIKQMSLCPAGGQYTLNPIGSPPTCTIPGHMLPP